MVLLANLLMLALGAGHELVLNGGFERIKVGKPESWDFYAEPPQAVAEISATAYTGRRAVMIHNRQEYDKDPCNNWSQPLVDLAGKAVTVKAWIKTESAGSAAVWLQCWKTQPLRVIRVVSSSDTQPITGSRNWTCVSIDVEAPSDTDFAILRCVLKGKGKAWFDDVSVRERGEQDEPVKKEPPKSVENDEKQVSEKYLELLRETADQIKQYQEVNEKLRQQVEALQGEVEVLKGEIAAQREKPSTTILLDEPQKTPATAPHILVPHGYRREAPQ